MTRRNEPSPRVLLRRLEAAERLLAEQQRAPRRSRRKLLLQRVTVGIAILLVALMPLSLLAADPTFSDLNEAATVHRTNIQAIGNVGITTGFEDPANPDVRLYNPKGQVTREEMASFLARTTGLGSNPPVANAKTAQTAANATHATNADHATGADQLGGQPASYYQPAGQPSANATNAANLGGQPASAYIKTSAAFVHRAIPSNISGHITTIDNPLTNGQPNALVFVTQNFNPGAVGPSVYNPHPFGVYYYAGKWTIFNEDIAAMPVNAQFNVLVIQP